MLSPIKQCSVTIIHLCSLTQTLWPEEFQSVLHMLKIPFYFCFVWINVHILHFSVSVHKVLGLPFQVMEVGNAQWADMLVCDNGASCYHFFSMIHGIK